MIIDIIYIFDLIGTFVFAISGALAASKKRLDIFGGGFAAFVTAVGGGTFRDLLIGRAPVGWLDDINYFIVIILALVITFVFRNTVMRLRKTMFLFDTIGIGVFTIIGLQTALEYNIHPVMASLMGLFSAVLGGVIRDVLNNDIPLIFKKEIYATACLAGAAVYLMLDYFGANQNINIVVTALIIIAIRIVSVRKNLSLPRFDNSEDVEEA